MTSIVTGFTVGVEAVPPPTGLSVGLPGVTGAEEGVIVGTGMEMGLAVGLPAETGDIVGTGTETGLAVGIGIEIGSSVGVFPTLKGIGVGTTVVATSRRGTCLPNLSLPASLPSVSILSVSVYVCVCVIYNIIGSRAFVLVVCEGFGSCFFLGVSYIYILWLQATSTNGSMQTELIQSMHTTTKKFQNKIPTYIKKTRQVKKKKAKRKHNTTTIATSKRLFCYIISFSLCFGLLKNKIKIKLK